MSKEIDRRTTDGQANVDRGVEGGAGVPLSTSQVEPLAQLAHPAPETEVVTTWKVACEGDEALGLGHPRVWLAISPATGFVECGYCDKRFVIDPDATNGH